VAHSTRTSWRMGTGGVPYMERPTTTRAAAAPAMNTCVLAEGGGKVGRECVHSGNHDLIRSSSRSESRMRWRQGAEPTWHSFWRRDGAWVVVAGACAGSGAPAMGRAMQSGIRDVSTCICACARESIRASACCAYNPLQRVRSHTRACVCACVHGCTIPCLPR